MSDQLFKDADEFERTYVGDQASDATVVPPVAPNPAFENGVMPTPPLYVDRDGLQVAPLPLDEPNPNERREDD
ncbi:MULTISPECIES: hypothetical protein [Herpetosiphon]|uniref:hypothetical protein n=1 Tax=Herpetosiphon TaxID=64 RepID=UPI0019577C34|nr:hypothetical protein [Herpetosiphon giganteus]MBM7845984.1 hypothetical protein [Herpetosiphon giganteus]